MVNNEFKKLFFNYLKKDNINQSRKEILPDLTTNGVNNFDLSKLLNEKIDKLISIETFGDLIIFIYLQNNQTKIAIFSKNLYLVKKIDSFNEDNVLTPIPAANATFIDSNDYLNIVYQKNDKTFFATFNDFLKNLNSDDLFFIKDLEIPTTSTQFEKFFVNEINDRDFTKYLIHYKISGVSSLQTQFNFALFRIEETEIKKVGTDFLFSNSDLGNNAGLHSLKFKLQEYNNKQKLFICWTNKDANDVLVNTKVVGDWKTFAPDNSDLDRMKRYVNAMKADSKLSNLEVLITDSKKSKAFDISLDPTKLNFRLENDWSSAGGGPSYTIWNCWTNTVWNYENEFLFLEKKSNTIQGSPTATRPPSFSYPTNALIKFTFDYKILTNANSELFYAAFTLDDENVETRDNFQKWNNTNLTNAGDVELVDDAAYASILEKGSGVWKIRMFKFFDNSTKLFNIDNYTIPDEIFLIRNKDFITQRSNSLFALSWNGNRIFTNPIYKKTNNQSLEFWTPDYFDNLISKPITPWKWLIRENNLLTMFLFDFDKKKITSFVIAYNNLGKESDPYLFEKIDNERQNLGLTRLIATQPNLYSTPKNSSSTNFDNSFIARTRNAATLICSTTINTYSLNNEKPTDTNFKIQTNANTEFLNIETPKLNKNETLFLNTNINLYFRSWNVDEILTEPSSTFASIFETYNESFCLKTMEVEIKDNVGIYKKSIDIKDYLEVAKDNLNNWKLYLRTSLNLKNNVDFLSLKLYNFNNEIIFNQPLNIKQKNMVNVEVEFDLISAEV